MEDFNCYIGINGHIVNLTTVPFYDKDADTIIPRHFKIIDNVWEEITEEKLQELKKELNKNAFSARLTRELFP